MKEIENEPAVDKCNGVVLQRLHCVALQFIDALLVGIRIAETGTLGDSHP